MSTSSCSPHAVLSLLGFVPNSSVGAPFLPCGLTATRFGCSIRLVVPAGSYGRREWTASSEKTQMDFRTSLPAAKVGCPAPASACVQL